MRESCRDPLRQRGFVRRDGLLHQERALRDRERPAGQEHRGTPCLHRRPAVLRGRRQLLGYHLRCRRQPFLRHAGQQGKDLPGRGGLPELPRDRDLENAECPSLSPDGRRIAFKPKNADDRWRLAVLDLATRRVTHPAETRDVDDQPLWRDNSTILYSLRRADNGSDIWSTPITPTGAPTLLIPDATSPALR